MKGIRRTVARARRRTAVTKSQLAGLLVVAAGVGVLVYLAFTK